MRTLVIDTATEALSVALFADDRLIAQHHEMAGRGHAEKLVPAIAALPDRGRADRIFVDVGPGSFTGVRIGVAAARALGLAWGAPVAGYGAPALIAAAARTRGEDRRIGERSDRHAGERQHIGGEQHADPEIAVAITGGHGELFWQCFDRATLDPRADVASTPIAALAGMLAAPVVHGSGAAVLVAARGHGVALPAHPDAADFLLLPHSLAALPPSPVYARGADARPMAVTEHRPTSQRATPRDRAAP